MKKVLSITLAFALLFALAVPAFAYETPVALGLYVGGWGADTTISVDKPGVYTLVYDGAEKAFDWIIVKNTAGEKEPTSVPGGTKIQVTELKIDGVAYTFDGGNATYDYTVGANGEIEVIIYLTPAFGGKDHIDNNPKKGSKIEVTFAVDPENITEEAPAVEDTETEAPAEDTETEAPAVEETPAETGLSLAVIPAIVALCAVAISKKR